MSIRCVYAPRILISSLVCAHTSLGTVCCQVGIWSCTQWKWSQTKACFMAMAAMMWRAIAVPQAPSNELVKLTLSGRKVDRPSRPYRPCWPLLLPHEPAASLGADDY